MAKSWKLTSRFPFPTRPILRLTSVGSGSSFPQTYACHRRLSPFTTEMEKLTKSKNSKQGIDFSLVRENTVPVVIVDAKTLTPEKQIQSATAAAKSVPASKRTPLTTQTKAPKTEGRRRSLRFVRDLSWEITQSKTGEAGTPNQEPEIIVEARIEGNVSIEKLAQAAGEIVYQTPVFETPIAECVEIAESEAIQIELAGTFTHSFSSIHASTFLL